MLGPLGGHRALKLFRGGANRQILVSSWFGHGVRQSVVFLNRAQPELTETLNGAGGVSYLL
jgi:hypothetical protein